MAERVRVFIIDDSAYMRKMLSQMLNDHPGIEVVGTARNGLDGLQQVQALRPDVITVDMQMPEMGGVEFVRQQMQRRRTPIVVVSSVAEDSLEAVQLGALEFVQKPTGLANERVFEMREQLVCKVLAAGRALPQNLGFNPSGLPGASSRRSQSGVDAIVWGVSTGGPQAIRFLLSRLPADFPVPLACVVHMPVGYTGPFATRLDAQFPLESLEATTGLEMRPGRFILAQAGRHLKLRGQAHKVECELGFDPLESLHRPSVDELFRSAAEVYGPRLLAVVMTGMGSDGTAGAAWVKAAGGHVLAEHESSCVVYGMPRSVIEAGLADVVRPLAEIPDALMEFL